MFHNISIPIAERMQQLEKLDQQDRLDGTPRQSRLRQIPPETGRFLALLAANVPAGTFFEAGTSAGYSTLWISLAATLKGRKVITFEVMPEKVKLANETFRIAGVEHSIELIPGDARQFLTEKHRIAFIFVDVEKESYSEIYEQVIPRLVPGGILAADNAINHKEALQPMLDRALSDTRVDSMIVPVGKGVLVCRKI